MNTGVIESTVEDAALTWFHELGYAIVHGPEIAPGELFAERQTHGDIVLVKRLREALTRINPHIPQDATEEAVRRVLHPETASLTENNRRFHQMLVEGVTVSYQRDGETAYDQVNLLDFNQPANNDWAAINQFTIIETAATAAPTFSSSSTACLWGLLNSKTSATKTPPSKALSTSYRPIRKMSPAFSLTTR